MARRTIKLWQLILAGPFLLWVGWHEYGRLDDLEKSGGKIYVDSLTKFLYDVGGKHAVLVVWCGFGVFYLWLCKRYFDVHRDANARLAALEQPKPKPEPAPPVRRDPPPRLGDDPFREPPRPAPIAVVRAPTAPAAVPMAAGNPDDGPKILR